MQKFKCIGSEYGTADKYFTIGKIYIMDADGYVTTDYNNRVYSLAGLKRTFVEISFKTYFDKLKKLCEF